MRSVVALAFASTVTLGCSSQPVANSSPTPSPASVASRATVVDPGCGFTQIVKGGTPAWLHSLEGSSTYQEVVPYALSDPPTVAGFLYGYPLRAGHPTDRNNKILWLVELPPRAGSLDVTAHLIDAASQTVRYSFAFLSSGDVPSIVDVAQAGCWQIDLAWSGHHASLDLLYK